MVDDTAQTQLAKLTSRLEKQRLFRAARRNQLSPLTQERLALIHQLEAATSSFLAATLTSATDDALAPFDAALKTVGSDISLARLRDRLLAQSKQADALCRRYEKEFDIHGLGERLPDMESRLTHARSVLLTARREVENLALLLQPVLELNDRLAIQGLPVFDLKSAAGPYAKPARLTHHLSRWLRDKTYRDIRRIVAPLEKKTGPVTEQIARFAARQTDLMVREHEQDLLTHDVEHTRGWLTAYVEAWASRLSHAQILAELRQVVADQMQSPAFRHALEAAPATCLPDSLQHLYSDVEAIDRRITQFYASFDARHAAGRIEQTDGDMIDRKRTPSNVSGTE